MKLIKENKYAKRIAVGLTTLVFSASMVSPFYNINEDNTLNNDIQTLTYEESVDDNYLTDDQINSLLSLIEIKKPEYTETVNYNVLIKFRNINDDYKVALAKANIVTYDGDESKYVGLFDAFTDKLLLVTARKAVSDHEGAAGELGIDLDNIKYVGKCMDGAHGVEIDYFTSMIDMAIKEKNYSKERILKYIPEEFDTDTLEMSNEELAKMYVDFVPMEYIISSNEIINGFERAKVLTA